MQSTVFISHRTEYAQQARALKSAIVSSGNIKVFTSEDLPHGKEWRPRLEKSLTESGYLFLLYGSPDEDWSWCFYEAGYFAAKRPEAIFCVRRPDVDPPGPLEHIQSVTDANGLIKAVQRLFEENAIEFDAGELRERIEKVGRRLFGELHSYFGYERIYFSVNSSEFDASLSLPADVPGAGSGSPMYDVAGRIPPGACVAGSPPLLRDLFGIHKDEIKWSDLTDAIGTDRVDNDRVFYQKWLDETAEIIVAARRNRFKPPQSILLARNGSKRCRFLLYQARVRADESYSCEFLVIDDVGGPAVGLTGELLALLTSIRMSFRFRYDIVERFEGMSTQSLSSDQRKKIALQVHTLLSDMTAEALRRGYLDRAHLLNSFEEVERNRVSKLLNYWTVLKTELYAALGLSLDGSVVATDGLAGPKLTRFRDALETVKLMNQEFLFRACGQLSKKMFLTADQLAEHRAELDRQMKAFIDQPASDPPASAAGAA